MELRGTWFDGQSGRGAPGVMRVDAQGQIFRDVQGQPCAELAAVTIPARLGTMPRTLVFASGWRFVSDQHDQLDALMGQQGKNGLRWVDRLERNRNAAIVGLVLLVVSMFGLYQYGIPAMARHTADALPAELLDEMATEALQSLPLQRSELPLPEQQRIHDAFARLLKVNGLPAEHYRLHLRSAPKIGPNAFALPSGDIVLLDQLVALTDKEDQWLGVLAHEVVHVEARHGLRGVLQSAYGALLLTLITGDASAATSTVMDFSRVVLENGYSRDLEREADELGAELMLRGGWDPAELATLFERLAEQDSGDLPGWLRSHPANDERIRALRQAGQSAIPSR
ncbi:M48 family metallopeptidase [Marinobacter hydrocarbonoclasticus]|nr:M48 family metallopeptidase [Marinobacter nauticus]